MKKRLYAVGPVEMYEETFPIGGSQVPYFRNQEFSDVVLYCMDGLKKLANCDEDGEVIMLTCSGTGAMEAVIVNCFNQNDNLLVIDGGSFGHRFVQLCEIHKIPHTPVEVPFGTVLTKELLEEAAEDGKYTGLLVNIHETSTGQLYNMQMLSDYCREHDLYFIVDAISSFLADRHDMKKYGIDAMIISSQKGLALAPGLGIVLCQPRILKERVEKIDSGVMYLDFKDHIINGKRGQTPFTPCVRVIHELKRMLELIEEKGLDNMLDNADKTAKVFREGIKEIGLSYPDYPLSNGCTPVLFPDGNAPEVNRRLIEEYGYVVNPSGGERANTMFRVGHIGNHSPEDSRDLVRAIGNILGK